MALEPVPPATPKNQVVFFGVEPKIVPFEGYDPVRGDPLPHVPDWLVWDYTGPLASVIWRLRRLAQHFGKLGSQPRVVALYMKYLDVTPERRFGIPDSTVQYIRARAKALLHLGYLRITPTGEWEATNDPWTID